MSPLTRTGEEFVRMLEFVEENKGRVSHILVYALDRFSRTGGSAIKLTMDLREKFGVTVLAVTQPTDTSNPSGVFLQNDVLSHQPRFYNGIFYT